MNQYTKNAEQEKKAYVESFLSDEFSYVGGFIDCEHKVTIKCNKCGNEFSRSMISIRHHSKTRCENCNKIAREKEIEAKRKEKNEREIERAKIAKQKYAERLERMREERAERKELKKHPCAECGEITTRKRFCSETCNNRYHNRLKEHKRRAKIRGAYIDKDITLKEVYALDNGICYICNGLCDWNDKVDGPLCIICGNNYPSIDHVIPLAKGGKHEWSNVRLAHRRCNSHKSDSIAPLCG